MIFRRVQRSEGANTCKVKLNTEILNVKCLNTILEGIRTSSLEDTLKLIHKASPKFGFKMLYKNTKYQEHKDRDSIDPISGMNNPKMIAFSKQLVNLGDYSVTNPTSGIPQSILAKLF